MQYIVMLSFSVVVYNVGGIGKTGILKVLKRWHTESYVSLSLSYTHSNMCVFTADDVIVQRSVGEIQWESSDTSNIYRLGHKGKVDLKCDTPGDGGQYYPGHLPVAGVVVQYKHTHTRTHARTHPHTH